VLVVAHQAVLMVFRYVLEGLDEAALLEIDRDQQIANASVTCYSAGGDGRLVLQDFNRVDHLLVEDEDVTEEPDARR
jgi:broad specificity phosphatase PhoE